VFRTDFIGNISRFKDVPPADAMPPLSEADGNLVMNIALPILGGHILMGADAIESMGFKLNFGNNINIMLEPDTRKETEELFSKLSKNGKVLMPLQDMFWGDYYGQCLDTFGVRWMFNCTEKHSK
jgi:PhnB protein